MLVLRRSAAALGALAAVSLVAATGQPAAAAVPAGSASAVTARIGLDVTLLNSLDVPVDVSLNAVRAPRSADGSVLRATVAGVKGGQQTLVDAKLGHSSAVVDKDGARASADLVGADVKVPGLLLHDVVTVDEVKASANCPAHGAPSAQVNVLGAVSVLGTKVSLSAVGPTRVALPGVGQVEVEFSQKTVTTRTAAATALQVKVTVNPGQLNVVRVSGTVELASVTCALGQGGGHRGGGPTGSTGTPTATSTAPTTAPGSATTPPAQPVSVTTGQPAASAGSPTPAPATTDLAETGGGSSTPVITGAALVLLGAGTGAVVLTRRRRRSQ